MHTKICKINRHQHTCIFSPDSDVSFLFFRLSFSSFAFSFRTAPPSGLLSPCPWSGPAAWLVSLWTKINMSESHILVWIKFLIKLEVLMVPAIELGLLQRDVRIRIQLSFFLHISFSFLHDTLADIQIYSFELSTFSVCDCLTLDLYSDPISSLPLRGLWIPAPPAVGEQHLAHNNHQGDLCMFSHTFIFKLRFSLHVLIKVAILELPFLCLFLRVQRNLYLSRHISTTPKLQTCIDVLTLLTPASSRISFISPLSVQITRLWQKMLFHVITCSEQRYKPANQTLTFASCILLILVSDDQPPVWCHLEAVLHLAALFLSRIGG